MFCRKDFLCPLLTIKLYFPFASPWLGIAYIWKLALFIPGSMSMCQPGQVTSTESDAGWGQRGRGPSPALRKPEISPVRQLLAKCCDVPPSQVLPALRMPGEGSWIPLKDSPCIKETQTHYREDGHNERHNGKNIPRSGKESWYISPKVNNPLRKWWSYPLL